MKPALPTRFATSVLLRLAVVALLLPARPPVARAQERALDAPGPGYVVGEPGAGRFALAASGRSAPLHVDAGEHEGVVRAVRDLQADVGRVSGSLPEVAVGGLPAAPEVVLVGTLGLSAVVDRLVQEGRLDVSGVAGRWEAFVLQVVEAPVPGVARALVVAGSDKRGTIYGVYDLAEAIGVSPWHYWADVPVRRQPALYVLPGRHADDGPAVRYRGIFLNDENPALLGWVNQTFGGFNHRFYEKVFELILRLKGNYLWPAMWGKAFADDDPLTPVLADRYGIVVGTSHHEPMMRAHVEWSRYGNGPWNYAANPDTLRAFWREGIARMGDHESLVTIGMRGDGDEPMTQGTAIALLERIVADQRRVIADVTGRPAEETPQVWALYKEVQDYYDQGMRVPDDVTLLFADDNWGNVRRLPAPGVVRPGGYGVYYHFDYVGGPRNYKWINTNQIERVWEQMHLAYRFGADRLWIVNVGDLKPMELPTDFFLDYAWDPEAWTPDRLPEYYRAWAGQQFGGAHAAAIGELLAAYTRFNSRRKPELLSPETYSLVHHREAERVVDDYRRLSAEALRLYDEVAPAHRDAFFQLVLFPVLASANVNELYVAVAKNRLYARQGRAAANAMADSARAFFARDAELTRAYHALGGGRWNHMMSQTHIGYTYWQEPPANAMPAVDSVDVPAGAEMGVAVEGSERWWPEATEAAVLPVMDAFNRQVRYVELFNRGREPFSFSVRSGAPWVRLSQTTGRVGDQVRLWVDVDWQQAPAGSHRVPLVVDGPGGRTVVVEADVFNPASPTREDVSGFVAAGGYASMEAEHFTRAVDAAPVRWQRIAGLGRTHSAMTPLPVTAPAQVPGGDGPRLEYEVHVFGAGDVAVRAYVSPTLDFHGTGGLRYAVSFDDQPPQVVNIHAGATDRTWEQWVSDNVNTTVSRHHLDRPGAHVLKFWMVDPGLVLQKLVVETGDVPPSYLGPPESFFRTVR